LTRAAPPINEGHSLFVFAIPSWPAFVVSAQLKRQVFQVIMDLSIIGSGYVGLVTGACFADVGHNVICVDNDARKIEALQAGKVPIYEPGLEEVIHRNVSARRLRFTGSIKDGVDNSQIVFIAVPTPQQPNGDVDLSYIEKVAREIAGVLTSYRVIVDKSTVPVKTGEKVAESIKRYNRHGAEFDVVSNPEFLREGCAVADLMQPDRIVIGAQNERAIDLMKKVYEPFMAPILVTDISSAELIKHAANSFLALKISYINALSAICEASGADVEKVADGIGMDRRIGRSFLHAGIGYGGSCFPKDIAAFITIAEQLGVPFNLLKEVQRINAAQKERFLKVIRDTLWVLREKKVAVWGLTFKPDTDDIRSSVAIDLVADMLREGAHVTAYDPKGMDKAREVKAIGDAQLVSSALETVEGAEALVIATEWSEFANVDLAVVKEKMTTPIIFDGRNLFDPKTMAQLGFHYHSIGRATVPPQ
jgi:UDPglucose 6-dehydrogenase